MLIPIAAANALGGRALLYYLIPYCAMSLGAFARRRRARARARRAGDARQPRRASAGSGRSSASRCATFMLGFLGFPLTGGFIGKFYAFAAAYQHGWWWLIVVGVVGTIVSAAYYLAVVRAMFLRDARRAPARAGRRLAAARPAALARRRRALPRVTVGSFFAVQPLIDVAQRGGRRPRRSRAQSSHGLTPRRRHLLQSRRASQASPGAGRRAGAGTARRRRVTLIAKTPRQATSDETASGGTPWIAPLRTAHESDEQRRRRRPRGAPAAPRRRRRGGRGSRRTPRSPQTAANGTAPSSASNASAVRAT